MDKENNEILKGIEENTELGLLQGEKIVEAVDGLEPALEGILMKAGEIAEQAKNFKPQEIGDGMMFAIKGVKGDKGEKGETGEKGADGKDGANGRDGLNGLDGFNGRDGIDGKDGADGKDGLDGKDGIDGKNGKDGKDGSPDTREEIKTKLDSFEEGEGIDYRKLAHLPDIHQMIRQHHQSSKTVSLSELDDVDLTGLDVVDGKYVLGSGSGGGGESSSYFVDQTPDTGTYNLLAGDVDGVNDTFTVSEGEYLSGTLEVELEGQGISQGPGDNEFVEGNPATGTFIFNTPPPEDAVIKVRYLTVSSFGGIQSVSGVFPVAVDNSDPLNPVISFSGSGTGTVTSVTGVNTNGFSWTIATATTTPELTLATSVSGIIKGSGGALTAAVAGTDYVAPGAITGSSLTMATARLLGRTTASTGAVEEIAVDSSLVLSGGTLQRAALTGDATASAGSNALTLATVNSNVGTFGSATQVPQITVNGKGLITGVTNVTITPAASSITGGAALTRTNDTNVTLTLGGSPTTALLAATSITVGWSGTLAASRGGTGQDSSAWSQGDLVYISATGTWNHLAKDTNSTRYLSNTGSSNNPAWAQINLANGVTGDLPFANLTQIAGFSILAKAGTGTGDVAALTAGTDSILGRNGSGDLTFATLVTNQITNDAVTYAKIQNVGSYKALVNDTNSSGDVSEGNWKSGVEAAYSGTITFGFSSGTTAPSGTANLRQFFMWTGNKVTFHINLTYAVAGANVNNITLTFPTEFPTPAIPTGFTGADVRIWKMDTTSLLTTPSGTLTNAGTFFLMRNAADNGFELKSTGTFTAGSYRTFLMSGFYFTS